MASPEQSSDLATLFAALQAEVALQAESSTATVAALQAEVTTLRAESAAAKAGRRRSRLRALVPILTLLCVMGLSLALMPTTRAQSPDGAPSAKKLDLVAAPPLTAVDTEKPAASPNATGGPLVIGELNGPTTVNDTTTLVTPGNTELMQNTLRVNNRTTTTLHTGLVANRRVAILGTVSGADTTTHERIGVLGASDTGTGVSGYSPGSAGIGVRGEAPGLVGDGVNGNGGRYGGYFNGTKAAIMLQPRIAVGPPTTGEHQLGELVVSSDGHLWFCRASGSPGEGVRLDLSSTFVPLVQK